MTMTGHLEVSAWEPRVRGEQPDVESSPAVDALWRDYKEHGGRETRERLILHYAPFVKFVALRAAAGLPANVEHCDVVSYGIFGLIDAIDKFDPSLGFKFETYALPRIRGAILDELRANDPAPRSIRAKNRAIERAFSTLATELGLSARQLAKAHGQISSADVVSLDEPLLSSAPERAMTRGEAVADLVGDPADLIGSAETSQILADEIRRLPERERLVLTLYYYEGLNLAVIGDRLGVTESRISQIHRKAIRHLRTRISEPAFAVG
jgi:RNA polymerase sigma factor for flagellar operon FliA